MAIPRETDLYDTLELPPDASISEIKKAYRKLALVNHPDKGGSREKFQKIAAAYEVLSDEEKKKRYDMYGKGGLQNGQIPGDIFSTLFGGNSFGGLGNIFNIFQNVSKAVRKTDPVTYERKVTLEELCTRKIIKIQVIRDRTCPCQKNSVNEVRCQQCNGQGNISITKVIGPGMMQRINHPCNSCKGRGVFTPPCGKCKQGTIQETKVFHIHLTPTMKNNHQYKFAGDGNEIPGFLAGDFIVIITHQPHPLFTVRGTDLVYKINITLPEALCGYIKTVTHPDGKEMIINFEGIIEPNEERVIVNKGMDSTGSLCVLHNITFPKILTQEQKEKVKEIFREIK